MRWLQEEKIMCYEDENIIIKSTANNFVLFNGILRDLRFTFKFSSDNLKENNKVECDLGGLAECVFYPFHILGAASGECIGYYDRTCNNNYLEIPHNNISQHTFSFEKKNGEVLLTAKLSKKFPYDWVDIAGGTRRRKPPYDLLPNEKTQGAGYSENIYLDPIKQLIGASMKNRSDIDLTCGLRNWYYAVEECVAVGRFTYPDGRLVITKNTENDFYQYNRSLFRPGVTVRDYVELGDKKYWYVADYSEDSNDKNAEASILFESDYAKNALLRFEGSFSRKSAIREERVAGKVRGYVAYYRIKGKISTVNKDDGEVSEDVDLYNDGDSEIEEIAVSQSKHKRFTENVLDASHYFSVDKNVALIAKSINLDDLVGLEKVKRTFDEFKKFGEYRQILFADSGQKANGDRELLNVYRYKSFVNMSNETNYDTVSLHMAFLGSPGTGKTTVAERVAAMLKEYGLAVTNETPIIVVKSDLVGQHIVWGFWIINTTVVSSTKI